MVVTPHRGDHSLSVDLTSDEISVTYGRQRFARLCKQAVFFVHKNRLVIQAVSQNNDTDHIRQA